MHACQDVEQEQHRIRNISLLLQEVPWYNQPTLVRILQLFQACTLPENALINGLNVVAVSVLSTPFILRPMSTERLRDPEELDRAHMAAAAAGSAIVEFMLTHVDEILVPVQQDLKQIQTVLTGKCIRLRALQDMLSKGVNTSLLADDTHAAIMQDMWAQLRLAERMRISVEANNSANPTSASPSSSEAATGSTEGA
jgi:hypothetical protein